MREQSLIEDDPKLYNLVQSELRLKHLARAAREIQKPRKAGRIAN